MSQDLSSAAVVIGVLRVYKTRKRDSAGLVEKRDLQL